MRSKVIVSRKIPIKMLHRDKGQKHKSTYNIENYSDIFLLFKHRDLAGPEHILQKKEIDKTIDYQQKIYSVFVENVITKKVKCGGQKKIGEVTSEMHKFKKLAHCN